MRRSGAARAIWLVQTLQGPLFFDARSDRRLADKEPDTGTYYRLQYRR